MTGYKKKSPKKEEEGRGGIAPPDYSDTPSDVTSPLKLQRKSR